MITCISMAFIIRSTSVIGWVPLLLFKLCSSPCRYLVSFVKSVPILVVLLLISLTIDQKFYGRRTFPQFNFVYLNVVENLS